LQHPRHWHNAIGLLLLLLLLLLHIAKPLALANGLLHTCLALATILPPLLYICLALTTVLLLLLHVHLSLAAVLLLLDWPLLLRLRLLLHHWGWGQPMRPRLLLRSLSKELEQVALLRLAGALPSAAGTTDVTNPRCQHRLLLLLLLGSWLPQ